MKKTLSLCAASMLLLATNASATIVEFTTSQGNFQVNLYDQSTPITVENFLNYVNSDRYDGTVIHRVATDFVVQGGGFEFNNALPLEQITLDKSIKNEPKWSNIRGTIAMAKLGNQPDSATSQWFFNLADNSTNLDLQNAGFTVFGQVIGDGMQVIDKIAALNLCSGTPIIDYSQEQCNDQVIPSAEQFVTITDVAIIDDSTTTENTANQVENTLIKQKEKSSGGVFSYLLACAALLTLRRRKM